MDQPKTTPKDFFLWAGAMLALYVSVFSFVQLIWNYINYAFPNPLQYYPADPYQTGISWEMASLIVLVPLFLVLMFFIHRTIARDPSKREIWVRRWALYFTVFAAAFTIVVELISLLYAFLNGSDLTTSFLLESLVVLLVAAVGFMHFLADLWGYWQQYPTRNRSVAVGISLLVALTIVAGFLIVGTPMQARLGLFDAQKVSDLQQVQSDIVSYWQAKGALPSTLGDLTDSLSNYAIPADPQTGASYGYTKLNAHSFNLCAGFNKDSGGINMQVSPASMPMIPGGDSINDNWQHGAGQVCFLRTIDPALYPPVKK